MNASFATEAGHWYKPDGTAFYEIAGANGNMRPTTLRDARKLGLFPSVTTILQMEAKPQLEAWKINQACLSCLTLPRFDEEDEDHFIKRALQDSKEQAIKARDRGTSIHGQIERFLASKVPVQLEDSDIVMPVITWLEASLGDYVFYPERSFASPLGFGGKIDLRGSNPNGPGHFVLDFKCKADMIPGKQLAYDEHCTQLAAYAYGMGIPEARCINIFVNTQKPGIVIHEWEPADIKAGWDAFQCLLKLWKIRKKV